MAERHRRSDEDARRAQVRTRILGLLVAVMVVAGVVALVLTLSGHDGGGAQAAGQPSGRQVGRETTSSPGVASSTVPAASTSATSAPTTSSPTTTAPATPSSTTAPSTTAPSVEASPSTKVVKYTVRRGDNLTIIARWFHQRGYSPLYDWNKSVIGRNPDLIHPGQVIIVSLKGDMMSVSTGSSA